MKISEVFPSKYLTAADLNGKPYTLTIKTVTLEEMITHENKKVNKPVCWFTGAQKGFVMNSTNAYIIVALYGDSTEDWIGQRITIYPTKVKAFGSMQDCIRVREEIPAQPKPVTASAQVEEPSGLDDDDDVADFDEGGPGLPTADASIWDREPSGRGPSGKSPDDPYRTGIGPAQLLRLTVLMTDCYGKDWKQLESKLAQDASKGSVSQFSELKLKEAQVLIGKLEAAIKQAQNGKVVA
jgi:hypothetical protein